MNFDGTFLGYRGSYANQMFYPTQYMISGNFINSYFLDAGYYYNLYDNYFRNNDLGVLTPPILDDDLNGVRAAPVILADFWANKNHKKFREQCGCTPGGSCSSKNRGVSFVAVDYNFGVGPGKYDIQVCINHYGKEYYGTENTFEKRWYKFKHAPLAYIHFCTQKLSGPNAPGRQGLFQNDNNETYGKQTGTLGLEVFDKRTGESVYRSLYYFETGFPWGEEWLRCGHNYGFQFKDN